MPKRSARLECLAIIGKEGNEAFKKKARERREAKCNEWEDAISLFEDLLDPLVCNIRIKRSYDKHRLILLSLLAAVHRRFSYSDIYDVN